MQNKENSIFKDLLNSEFIEFVNIKSKNFTGKEIDIMKLPISAVMDLKNDFQDYRNDLKKYNHSIDILKDDKDFINFYKQI